jgi:cellulose synthase/poly-beta-1,6-N-acetylglucosamine synthase-like glycosyltransferase
MKKIAVLIPAFNEEKVIGKTIQSILRLVNKDDIFVVNDGSTDKTGETALKLVPNVLNLRKSVGKASASSTAIKYFKLTTNYKYLLPMDADTRVGKNFLEESLPVLEDDTSEEIVCVVGKVKSRPHNWLTFYRLWEYEIAQSVHKQAQAIENAVIICPGCATLYRSNLFDKVNFPPGTLTEDMDLTFLIHRLKLGKIAFSNSAEVITQDPSNFRDYLKQLNRWYTGFWQCVAKHNIPWGGQMLDLEVGLLALEGLFNGLLVLLMVLLIPLVFVINPWVLFIPFFLDLFLFLLPTVVITAGRHKTWKIFRYLPHFYLLRAVGSLIFLKSFLNTVLALDIRMSWGKVARY